MSVLVESVQSWPQPSELFPLLAALPGIFFLDSAWPNKAERTYSFIGFKPFQTLEAQPGCVTITDLRFEKKGVVEHRGAATTILEVLRNELRKFAGASHERIPFTGGAVGYFGYELGAAWEIIPPRPQVGADSVNGTPVLWAEFSFYDGLLAFEHETKTWFCAANACAGRNVRSIIDGLTAAVSHALSESNAVLGSKEEKSINDSRESPNPFGRSSTCGVVDGRSDRRWYLESVAKVKEYIAAGDIYQVNLAHAFDGRWFGPASELYARLRAQTPAPFGAFITTRDGALLSSSPESFLRIRADVLETRPIKGTRARSGVSDAQATADLTASAKERAELLMIVDLERNDLARVCRPGTVEVTELYGVETHPTVLHLVATVRGQLAPGKDAIDAVRAMFPGGSITGAPKIRAMQIIREMETEARGAYTGAIGYFGFDGSADFNIAIRTLVMNGENVSYHVGAGIVWDSHPESEYEETLAKGKALRAAIEARSPAGPAASSSSNPSTAALHVDRARFGEVPAGADGAVLAKVTDQIPPAMGASFLP